MALLVTSLVPVTAGMAGTTWQCQHQPTLEMFRCLLGTELIYTFWLCKVLCHTVLYRLPDRTFAVGAPTNTCARPGHWPGVTELLTSSWVLCGVGSLEPKAFNESL